MILLLAFAMLAQRRVMPLINLFALQGLVLCLSTLVVAVTTGQTHLYWSAGLTLLLKALLLPWILHRLVRKLQRQGRGRVAGQRPDHHAGRHRSWSSSPSTSR